MLAWQVDHVGDPDEVLHLTEIDVPAPGPGQVLLRTRTAGVNFPDYLVCRGIYQVKPPLPFTPGHEVCGDVIAVGPGARATVGSRVAAVTALPAGGWAPFCLARDGNVFDVPHAMADDVAAAFVINYQTAYLALNRRAHLRAGETLLVQSGAGGVGSAAIQVGRAMGARVIATAGTADRANECRRLGADVTIDYSAENIVEAVRAATAGAGVDVVCDTLGGPLLLESIRCMGFEGRMVVVGFTSGDIPAIPANRLLLGNCAALGLNSTTYRTAHPDVVRAAHGELLKWYGRGEIKPRVGMIRPMAEARETLRDLVERRIGGKAVLSLSTV